MTCLSRHSGFAVCCAFGMPRQAHSKGGMLLPVVIRGRPAYFTIGSVRRESRYVATGPTSTHFLPACQKRKIFGSGAGMLLRLTSARSGCYRSWPKMFLFSKLLLYYTSYIKYNCLQEAIFWFCLIFC